MFRPKVFLPKFVRPMGMGDCTTCEPSIENEKCYGYFPAPKISFVNMDRNEDD